MQDMLYIWGSGNEFYPVFLLASQQENLDQYAYKWNRYFRRKSFMSYQTKVKQDLLAWALQKTGPTES